MAPKTRPTGSELGSVDITLGPVDGAVGSLVSERASPSTRQGLFGSPARTDLLVLVAGLGRSFPRELSRLTNMPMTTVIRALDDLERAGVFVSTRLGGTREVRLNPDYVAAGELRILLEALVEREPRYREIITGAARRRPRRSGKPI